MDGMSYLNPALSKRNTSQQTGSIDEKYEKDEKGVFNIYVGKIESLVRQKIESKKHVQTKSIYI